MTRGTAKRKKGPKYTDGAEWRANIEPHVKPELRPGSRTCQCGECEEYFAAPSTFDLHRTFENPKVEDWDTRRCMTPDEMEKTGLRRNPYGVWLDKRRSIREGVEV